MCATTDIQVTDKTICHKCGTIKTPKYIGKNILRCRKCANEQCRESRKRNTPTEEQRAKAKARALKYLSDPNKRKAANEKSKEWQQKNKDRYRYVFPIGSALGIHYLNCVMCGDKKTLRRPRKDKAICVNCRASIYGYQKNGGLFRECKQCGLAYNAHYGNTYTCSIECAKKRKRELIRPYKQKRSYRSRVRDTSQMVENVYRLKVFDRDKWRCKMCKCRVYKSTKDRSKMATLDHIIPLSKGGSHSMSNVQTLCFMCNSIKSDKADGLQITIFCKTQ